MTDIRETEVARRPRDDGSAGVGKLPLDGLLDER
jgi:hypothetical protein